MKKILPFMLLIPFLFGCKNKEEIVVQKHYEYKDFEKYRIEWKNLFFTAKTHYFAYIYSESCYHCIEIKDLVLPYFENENFDIFLIQYSSEIPLGFGVEETLEKQSVESIWILGVPTLIEIDNGMVVNNVAGKEDILFILEKQSH